MSSLKSVLYIFLVQISRCYFYNEYPKNVPFLDYHVVSTNLLDFHNISDMKRNIINDRLFFEVKFDDLVLKIVIRLKNIEIVNWKSKFSIYGEKTEDYIDVRNENFELVEGFVISNQNASSVIGYIKNTYFYGTIFFGTCIYYIEDLNNYLEIYEKYRNSKYNAVIYNENFLNLPSPQKYDEEQPRVNKNIDFSLPNSETNKELYKSIIGNGKVCTLLVLIDNAFLRRVHDNNIKSAIAQVLTTIEEANSLFRSTDFDNDGYPDNIGFLVKYLIVLESEKSPMNVFPKNEDHLINSDIYLNMFSRYELLTEVCLGLAFTGYEFKNNVLGVSYTATASEREFFKNSLGGICNRPHKYHSGRNFNTLAISARRKNGGIVPQHLFDLGVVHELGHSFGSGHDVSASCIDHLMTPAVPKKTRREHFTFSSCSKRMILRTIISKGHCFENYDGSFCGNGIIEPGEICDCGTIRNCQYLDVCCTPRGRKNSCEVNKKMGYECHPSEGMCCTPKCNYKDLSRFDLKCRNFEKTCPCEEISKPCTCGVNGQCTGNICSSEECTRISLPECGCPTNITYNKCKICCSYNNSCLPASFLTEMLIKRNKTLGTHLKLLEHKTNVYNIFGIYKTFHFEQNSLKLHFREVNVNDYCLLFGKLGICSTDFNCTIPKFQQIYQTIHVLRTPNGGKERSVACQVLLVCTVSLVFL